MPVAVVFDRDVKGGGGGGPVRLTPYVMMLTFLCAIGGFLFGYDTGIISGAMLFIREELKLNHIQVEFVVGGDFYLFA